MSGTLGEADLKGLVGSGFDGYLKKPFNVRQVIQTIEDATNVTY